MSADLMSKTQHSPSPAWALPAGTAMRLPASPRPRFVAVLEGRVWLTPSVDDDASTDCWLAAGERAPVAPGVDVVVEGWPSARFAVLEAASPSRRRFTAWRGWFARWRERAQWTPRVAPCA